MILYNITISVEDSIESDWLEWMQIVHIPEVMGTGLFAKSQINRILSEGDSNHTFAISYTCSSMKIFHEYHINFAPQLQKKTFERYGNKVVAFRTLMEVISEFK